LLQRLAASEEEKKEVKKGTKTGKQEVNKRKKRENYIQGNVKSNT